MKQRIKISLFFLLPGVLVAQNQLINNGAVIKVENGANLRVDNGSILNKNAGSINNSGNIYLDADYNQTTTAVYSGGATGWLWFEGAALQQISGDAPLSVAHLRVDNGNLLDLAQQLTVTTSLDLSNNGNIRLNGFDLIADNVAITNYDVNNYIITNSNGSLRQTFVPGEIKEYPVGNSSYNPVILLSNGGADDVFSVRVEDAVLQDGTGGAAVTDHVVNRSWHITEGTTGGNDMDIAVEWATAEELGSFDRTQSGIAHWDGTQWELPVSYTAATGGSGRWTQTRSNQSTFSPFVVEDALSDLPIELLSFDAYRLDADRIKLEWATATEINNAGFEVERMFDNETTFKKVGFVEGYGNSVTTIHYGFNDPNAYPGISYYRLRQVDIDGTTTYTEIRAVSGMVLENSDPIVVYPNPSKDIAHIRFGALAPQHTSAMVRLLDMRGALVQEFEVGVAAYQSFDIDVHELASGAYHVILVLNTGEQQVLRLIRE